MIISYKNLLLERQVWISFSRIKNFILELFRQDAEEYFLERVGDEWVLTSEVEFSAATGGTSIITEIGRYPTREQGQVVALNLTNLGNANKRKKLLPMDGDSASDTLIPGMGLAD